MSKRSTDRVVAVTGGARGIGLATARTLLARGYRVAIGDIDPIALKQAADELAGDRLITAELDVTDRESFSNFLDIVESGFGPVDVFVNNAGIMPIGPLLDETDATARRMVDINVHGVILGTKLVLARMLAHGGGHIVNIASVAGRVSSPGQATYCATKHAIVGFTEAVRMEFGARGIDVSMVLPSFTATDMIAGTRAPRFVGNLSPEQVAEAIAGVIERPRAEVILPAITAPAVLANAVLPRPIRQFLARSFGTDTVFLEFDSTARTAYDQRIN